MKIENEKELFEALCKVDDGHIIIAEIGCVEVYSKAEYVATPMPKNMENREEIEDNVVFELPVPIGGTVYESDFPIYPNRVMGYRIGRMMGEDEEDYEEDGYEDGVWYIQYARGGIDTSAPISAIGESIFLTQEEAEHAASLN